MDSEQKMDGSSYFNHMEKDDDNNSKRGSGEVPQNEAYNVDLMFPVFGGKFKISDQKVQQIANKEQPGTFKQNQDEEESRSDSLGSLRSKKRTSRSNQQENSNSFKSNTFQIPLIQKVSAKKDPILYNNDVPFSWFTKLQESSQKSTIRIKNISNKLNPLTSNSTRRSRNRLRKVSSPAQKIISKNIRSKTTRTIVDKELEELKMNYLQNKKNKFVDFKKAALKNSFKNNDSSLISKNEDDLKHIYKSLVNIKNYGYLPQRMIKFEWDPKVQSSKKQILTKKYRRNPLKKIKKELQGQINELPIWLQKNTNFVDSFKHGLLMQKNEILKIVEKQWFMRTPLQSNMLKNNLIQQSGLEALPAPFFDILVNDIKVHFLLESSYLFGINEKPVSAFLIYEGSVMNDDTEQCIKRKSLINKEILEESDYIIKDNLSVQKSTVVFEIPKKSFMEFRMQYLKENRGQLARSLRNSKRYFKDCKESQLLFLVDNSILRFRSLNEGILKQKDDCRGLILLFSGVVTIKMKIDLEEDHTNEDLSASQGSFKSGSTQNRNKRKGNQRYMSHSFFSNEGKLFNSDEAILEKESIYDITAFKQCCLIEIPVNFLTKILSTEKLVEMNEASKISKKEFLIEKTQELRFEVFKDENSAVNESGHLIPTINPRRRRRKSKTFEKKKTLKHLKSSSSKMHTVLQQTSKNQY